MIRSSNVVLDGVFCGAQGAAIAGLSGFNPINGAICLGSIAIAERVFSCATKRFVPGPNAWLGPIPIGSKNVISYGLATYTTVKVMQLAGLIIAVPSAVQIIGVISAVVLAGGLLYTVIKDSQKSLDEQLQEHVDSKVYANRLFNFEDQDGSYKFRIIVNPEKKKLKFSLGVMGTISCSDHFIVVADQELPDDIERQIKSLLGDKFSFLEAKINDCNPISYTANPVVEEK